jgi:hypothetical protein
MAMLLFPAPRNESVGVVVEIFFVVFCVCGISVQSFVTLRMAVLRSVYRSGDLAIGTFVVVDLSPIDVSLSRTKSRIRCLAQQGGPRGAGSLNLIHHCLLHPLLLAASIIACITNADSNACVKSCIPFAGKSYIFSLRGGTPSRGLKE